MRRASYWSGFLLVMLALTVPVAAGLLPEPVPEIGGGSLATGLGLLSGALLIVRSRWKTK